MMRVRTETTDLTRLTRLGFVNAYLVREADGLTLVDTMLGGSARGILDAARGAGLPIGRIVLTHAHGDHAGSLDALAAELPDAGVIVSEREAPLLAHDLRLVPGEPGSKLRGSWPKGIATRPTRLVNDGDRIGSLRV